MQIYSLHRSAFDPEYVEVIVDGSVVQEVKVLFKLPSIPHSFSSLEEVLSWLNDVEQKLTKAYAYRLLSARSYSKMGLFQKLKMKGFSEKVSLKVMGEVEKLGFLSDEDFGRGVVDQKIAQGYGPMYIERYLSAKGLDPRLARERMDREKQRESLKKWEQKLKGKEKNKKIAFLLRRGFDFSAIQNI
jgi:SOS response regulatory protein OraA/RecX